jgi:hypothetical protein
MDQNPMRIKDIDLHRLASLLILNVLYSRSMLALVALDAGPYSLCLFMFLCFADNEQKVVPS